MLKRWWVLLAPVAALCAAMAASTGSASASVNVITAIQQQNSVLGGRALQRVLKLESSDKQDPAKLYHALDAFAVKCDHAATVVSHSSVDSTRQGEGRREWVAGARDIAGAYYKLGHAFHQISEHHVGADTLKLIARAKKLVAEGEALARKASHLLDTPTG